MNNIERLLKKKELKELNNISTDSEDNLIMKELGTFLEEVCSSEDVESIRDEQNRVAKYLYELQGINKVISCNKDLTERTNIVLHFTKKVRQSSPDTLFKNAEMLFNIFNAIHREIEEYCSLDFIDNVCCNEYDSTFNSCLLAESDPASLVSNIYSMCDVIQSCCAEATENIKEINYSKLLNNYSIASSAVFIIYTYAEKLL